MIYWLGLDTVSTLLSSSYCYYYTVLPPMPELKLWYFFEGTDMHDYVVISRDADVGQLRNAIYEKERKTNLKDVGSSTVVLLRVCQTILFLFPVNIFRSLSG